MPNTSATGGYLAPATSPPEDDDLDAIFQSAIAGITGLPGKMIRPRWQSVVPKQPEPSENWCAFGVMSQDSPDGPYIEHLPASDGSDKMRRHEDITVLCTFYGPSSKRNALILSDGLHVPQNGEALKASGISFINAGTVRPVPEFVNQQWIKRADIALRFRRQVSRAYAVQNILSADISLVNDDIGQIDTILVTE